MTTMSSIDSNKDELVPEPDELARDLAAAMRRSEEFDPVEIGFVEHSDEPLAERLASPLDHPLSIGSIARWHIIYALDEREDVYSMGHWNTLDDRHFSFRTHPSLLAKSNRLVVPAVLAKCYQYGYRPTYLILCEGGPDPTYAAFQANSVWEFRELTVKKWTEPPAEPLTDVTFDETAAVAEFASRVAADEVSWERYLPWFETITVPAYRLESTARETDFSAFPPKPPTERVEIDGRFEPAPNPRVGDFVRAAVLRKLESAFPSVDSLSTGPGSWSTDRVTMVIRPTGFREPGIDSELFVPPGVLGTLDRLGYRVTDAWYNHPDVGHESADPISPRTVEFTRGSALRTWIDETLPDNQLFADASVLAEQWAPAELPWRDVIRATRTVTVTYRELYEYAQTLA